MRKASDLTKTVFALLAMLGLVPMGGLPATAGFEIGANLTGVADCSVAWGDYDGDGDLDLAVAGSTGGALVSKIYRNDTYMGMTTFIDIGAGLEPVAFQPCLAWGDYDNDGDLDLALAGMANGNVLVSKIYRNDPRPWPYATYFSDIGAGLTGVAACSLAWGDYDNDGDLDLALAGSDFNAPLTKIYANIKQAGGNREFVEDTYGEANLTPVYSGSLAWGDYNNDGRLDLAIVGNTAGGRVSKIYSNDYGIFSEVVGAGLVGVAEGTSLAWGDYDNDGYLDLALAGEQFEGSCVSLIYHNQDGSGSFTDSGAMLAGVQYCSLAWGDYDNNGYLDLALTGQNNGMQKISRIYQNDNPAFNDIGAGLLNVFHSSVAWGDYDNDGRLDLALAGNTGGDENVFVSYIYRNNGTAVNTAPVTPTGLSTTVIGSTLTVRWNAATDAQTPQNGLSYNLRVGTTPGGADVFSGMADLGSGYRRLPATGNAQKNLSWKAENVLPSQKYYCSVQAIDAAFAGSAWAAEVASGDWPVADSWTQWASDCSLAWGDYDNDGDLDLALAGAGSSTSSISQLYRNDQYDFVDAYVSLTGVRDCALAWGDYDNDGYRDLALAGFDGSSRVSKIYRNEIGGGGSFAPIGASLTGVSDCALAWGDYDNDGDLDLALAGFDGSARVSKIYRNDSNVDGSFTPIAAGLTGVSDCSLAWADYDNDGDLDLALAGFDGSARVSKIYRNDGGSFAPTTASLTGVSDCSLAWGDYDNDGDLDLALAGFDGSARVSKIYGNDGGSFAPTTADLTGVDHCSLAWGDYDNDGKLDLALAGMSDGSGRISRIYRNNVTAFTDIAAGLTGVDRCSLAWADWDNDGDLDLALAGATDGINMPLRISRIYCNIGDHPTNMQPWGPRGLSVTFEGGDAVFSWQAADDDATPQSGLSYNLRVGTTPGDDDVFCGMANLNETSGYRRLPAIGNAQKKRSWKLKFLPADEYYWSVQAVDTAFAGGLWATEHTVEILKGLPDESQVTYECVEVYGVQEYLEHFPDDHYFLYVRRGLTGIRVHRDYHGFITGDTVSVIGTLGTTADGERYIDANDPGSITYCSSGLTRMTPLSPPPGSNAPLMCNRAVGGGDWCYDPITGAGQRGITGASGVNTVGMQATTYGVVTQKSETGLYMYVDDGSHLLDGTYTDLEANVGVRVRCWPGDWYTGDWVTVTGPVSLLAVGDWPEVHYERLILGNAAGCIRRLWP
ncbi:MAG: VCBS repeat-containing protein [Armatimonadota bacterium]|nr:VCBS repeat-containing protein [Armatimonadota bacterium]